MSKFPVVVVTSVVAILLLFIGLLVYALLEATVATLRWWAGLTTVGLPLVAIAAYYLGRIEAQGRLAGLQQGIEAVTEAARKTADVRVSTAQRMRQRQPTPTVQQVFLPGGSGGPVVAPHTPASHADVVEL